jgi:hypothetical protein
MSIYIIFVLVFLAAILVGVLLSLIVLLPPIRRAGMQNAGTRRILIGLFSIAAFATLFLGGTRLFAVAMVHTISDTIDRGRELAAPNSSQMEIIETWDRIRGDALTELWLRQLYPDQGFSCLSGKLTVCEQMGSLGIFGTPTWGIYAMYIVTALVSAIASGFSVCKFTSQKKET